MADHVVEQGASKSWRYRKWGSGKAECWRNIAISSASTSSTYGGLYYYTSKSYSFPFAFVENPIVVGSVFSGNGLIGFSVYELSASGFAFWLSNQINQTISPDVMVYACGRWR